MGTHSDLDGQAKEEQSEPDGTLGTLLGVEESNTNTDEVKRGTNQQEGDDQSSNNNNNNNNNKNDSIKNKLIIENDSRLLTNNTTDVQSMIKEKDVNSPLILSNIQSNSTHLTSIMCPKRPIVS
jgi:hypothetical protein